MFTGFFFPSVVGAWYSETLRYIRSGEKPRFRRLVSLDNYFQNFWMCLVVSFCIAVGIFIGLFPAVLLGTWWLYSMFELADSKTSFVASLEWSKRKVTEEGKFGKHFVILMAFAVLNMLSLTAWGIGVLFTLPFSFIFMGLMYLDLKEPLHERTI
jgi:hypothetical protein